MPPLAAPELESPVTGGVITQANRLLMLDTPLPKDTLLITSLSGEESLSGLFHYDIEMIAQRDGAVQVKPEDLIGKACTVRISLSNDYVTSPQREMNGIVSRFVQKHADRRFFHYRAELVPWISLLKLTSDCRIFQGLSIPNIVEKIFGDLKATYPDIVAWRDALTKTYTKLDYCVQYRESTFDFVSRLFEQEGIFYFFEHSGSKHTLVLADSSSVHKPCPDQATAVYVPEGGWQSSENPVTEWEVKREMRSGKYTVRDFHMQMPEKTLEFGEPSLINVGGNRNLEIYFFRGEYARRFNKKERQNEVEEEGSKLIRLRMEAEELANEEVRGQSFCCGFIPGFSFTLTDHFDRSANTNYVLKSVRHMAIQAPAYVAEDEFSTPVNPYQNSFTCIPETLPFRPPRTTTKPVVQGPQTAMVVGKPGEEIWTDEFSRVKVQFHWDRQGKHDENSSCWIRVSQPWAGVGWGSVSVPRVGQEVIVDFIEGDPDQPIITGRVYNSAAMPPYALPKAGMVSGLKSNSTPGGGGYNEMSMNDTKGKEKVTIHAQYDMDTTVLHDDTQTVTNGNRTIAVKTGKHTETIKGDTAITVQSGAYSLDVQSNTFTHHVAKAVKETFDATQTTTVKNDISVQSTAGAIFINAAKEIKLVTGASYIDMTSDGTIKISGNNIIITAGESVKTGVGNQNVVCDRQKVATSGASVSSSAIGMHEITGGVVKIN